MPQDTPEVVLVRLIHAPRPLVFQAWTDPRLLALWWAPAGFSNPVCEIDPRVGGALHIVMQAEDGTEFPMRGVIQEIEPPERILFTDSAFDDEFGVPKLEGMTQVTFEDLGPSTRLTVWARILRHTPDIADAVSGMSDGWNESLDKLALLLEGVKD